MTAQTFLSRIEDAGFNVEADGERLIVSPFSKLTDEQRAFIKRHKDELLVELAVRRWMPGGECYERIRSGWRLSRTPDGGYVWLEPGSWTADGGKAAA
jgi:hypothetical protein